MTPERGTGRQFGIACSLDSGRVWIKRKVTLPEGEGDVQRVQTLLPSATDLDFWRSGEIERVELRNALAEWIVGEQQAFMARVQRTPERQQDSLSAAEAHGVAIEATPYSKDEPGKHMAINDKEGVVENIGLLSWKVCTMNGNTFEIGWTFSHLEEYTTCTVTLEEPVTTRKHIRDKFPAKDGRGFWSKALFEPHSLCGSYSHTIGKLTSMIIDLRGIYGLPAPKR